MRGGGCSSRVFQCWGGGAAVGSHSGVSAHILGVFQGPSSTQSRSQAMSLSSVTTRSQTTELSTKPGAKRKRGARATCWPPPAQGSQRDKARLGKVSGSRMMPSRALSPSPWSSCRCRTRACTGARSRAAPACPAWRRSRSTFPGVGMDLPGNLWTFHTPRPALSFCAAQLTPLPTLPVFACPNPPALDLLVAITLWNSTRGGGRSMSVLCCSPLTWEQLQLSSEGFLSPSV